MKVHPRRPYFSDIPDGYLEGDRDYVENNLAACVEFLDTQCAHQRGESAMRMIKVGEKYLGLVDAQSEAIRFNADVTTVRDAVNLLMDSGISEVVRSVKLTTLADRTAASMRGLATDIEGSK